MLSASMIAKAATPEQRAWRARIAAAEPQLVREFLDWVDQLVGHITESALAQAVTTGATSMFDHVLQAVTFSPTLAPVAEAEAERDFARLFGDQVRLTLDLRDPAFATAVFEHQARLVREVTTGTRRAIANMIERGYRTGRHPYQVAQEIRPAIGLTARQAQAVMNFADAQRKLGLPPDKVADRALRYAARMRTRRARTIARTETARAAVTGRLAGYEQAARHGLFDTAAAELEWSSVQDDPAEVCAQLDGRRVPFEIGTFDGLLPPVHPMCRCSVHLVLAR